MGKLTRVEITITLGLSWLLAAACGGAAMAPAESVQQFDSTKGTTPNTAPPKMPAAGNAATSTPIVRASARIEPLAVVAPATPSTMTGATAGATASAAGMGASTATAGTSAAAGTGGASASTGGSTGSAGAGGTGMGAGIAAGSGGEAGATVASAGTGATGTGGMSAPAAGAAGMTAAPSTPAAAGTAAPSVGPKAGTAGSEAPANIMGSANFASNANGVNLTVMVSGCQSGKEYPIHLHQGSSCESAMTQGGHWDMTRGEGIPNIKCGGRQGATTVMRAKTDATTTWSVGDMTATDVVGRTVVIHDADDPTVRIACGVIAKN
jgi:hypothetical protein